MTAFWQFMVSRSEELGSQALTHLGLTFVSLLAALLLAVPLGLLITRKRKLATAVLGFAGVVQTIPSIALLGFMIPILGIGVQPAIFALFLYALLPIIRNTYTGITGIDPALLHERFEHRLVAAPMFALPGYVIPIETQPGEILGHRGDELGARARAVEVLEPKLDLGSLAARVQPTEESGQQGAGVGMARRGRSETTPCEACL